MINVEVQKNGTENALSLIRKFSRRVQSTGMVKQLRAKRYRSRDISKSVQKKSALKMLRRRAEYRTAIKEGKIAEPAPRRQLVREKAPTTHATGSGLGENTPIAR